jgi:hypothetical protein
MNLPQFMAVFIPLLEKHNAKLFIYNKNGKTGIGIGCTSVDGKGFVISESLHLTRNVTSDSIRKEFCFDESSFTIDKQKK